MEAARAPLTVVPRCAGGSRCHLGSSSLEVSMPVAGDRRHRLAAAPARAPRCVRGLPHTTRPGEEYRRNSVEDPTATDAAHGVLLELLAAHRPWDRVERRDLVRTIEFVRASPEPFNRDVTRPGHVVASAWILERDQNAVLFVYHPALGRWLQPGGHGEAGEFDPRVIAGREVREEAAIRIDPAALMLFDVEIQCIPASRQAAHLHFDLRFTAEAPRPRVVAPDVRWFAIDDLPSQTIDAGIARMLTKSFGTSWRAT